ncbi:MAG: hypothetical protein M0P73_17665 [Syntrophobacterales bacterium]|jgi:hypothetical protein|nr:hypothetical protein [Syntrophobacterales bacterium]
MSIYLHLDSNYRPEHNLQLYSLQKAANDWNERVDLIVDHGINHVDHPRERLVFILSSLGLSLSQLLGQNCPSPGKEKMDKPGVLLGKILIRARVDRTKRCRLNKTFSDFLLYYGAVRHFGENKNKKNYHLVDQLTPGILDQFRRMTIEIWNIIIAMYRNDPKNDIDDFRSISDVVGFKDIAEVI